MILDDDVAYRAVETRDARFDGQFILAVRTTGIYCRPACPARKPLRRNAAFFPTAAAAQAAGFRACRRCLPDAAPGSPEWNLRADTVGAAMRLIADGVIDREGVPGLATRLGYTSRHLNRMLLAELGASPLALARARRAHTARLLLTTTSLPISEIAFAAGFSSIRQFNETVQEIFATAPSELRRDRLSQPGGPGVITLRLPVRQPFDGKGLLAFFALRAIAGVEKVHTHSYTRSMQLPGAPAVVELTMPSRAEASVLAKLHLGSLADLTPAVERCRRILDLDADPVGIDALLSADPVLAPRVAAIPGIRVPGTSDGAELVVRAILGQQVSVVAARTAASKLTHRVGHRLPEELATATGLTHLFPTSAALAELADVDIGGPRKRAATLLHACRDLASGSLVIDPGRRSADLQVELCARTGIGPWTAGYLAMRVLGDPDVLLATDLVQRQGANRLGLGSSPAALRARGARWRPFSSYAGMHLWRAASITTTKGP
ncbi:DNA-3-methyladenine glycosylase 2 family protein [Nakamurella antarctica]|uniref:DNA-3-methyladenine glycosylase II n=1 Tax=Nakamurella antarctica TaxID=1902245 RepID=A0A3G8ZJF9_9ACTN|nr:AlkA N-terminal domain-containing protein [Nakamurella antarctica]AZI57403.1 DNA-3-methyladenine glycosylase 2 family protein [Nakamurella antarctica]